ncbi:hypothetical protein LCC91_06610 [Tepidimonas taiwanensis]|uniref:hypothetical protein n=1 Tax=Tepidimonas taiwanensis TaxID=307486 RepID=UPI001CCEA683|nr:hypothetical protein [Tepidimonas taiwanensis]UBQ06727.1 hypothetical protein LCC91_06610 [Tepidimonas taiwanensis]
MFQLGSGSAKSPPASGAENPASVEALRQRARRRLIGATILVALAVIVVPMVLESQPRPIPVDIAIDIPARDGLPPLERPAARGAEPAGSAVVAGAAPATATVTPPATAAAPAPGPIPVPTAGGPRRRAP